MTAVAGGSAAALPHPQLHQQPQLDGMPPPATPPYAEPDALKVCFMGALSAPAAVRITRDNDVLLEVALSRPVEYSPGTLAVSAALSFTADGRSFAAAHEAATAKAGRLPAGTEVLVLGRGLAGAQRHHAGTGAGVVHVIETLAIDPVDCYGDVIASQEKPTCS